MRKFNSHSLSILLLLSFTTLQPHLLHAFSSRRVHPGWRLALPSLHPSALFAGEDPADDDVCTIQILMSDTGGGHRASANALRDAFDVLYPGRIEVDIVDIYTDYGPFFPYNDYVELYKIMAKYDFLWEGFYYFGATEFGLCLNEVMLETFCFDSFKECMERPSGSSGKRADMVVSVHPLCQDLPLKILASLDSNGRTREREGRTTPFVTVVTDLGGAHPTWFNPGVDKCFVPTDVLYERALDRKVEPSQLIEYGLPIRKGFWDTAASQDTSSKPGRVRKVLGSLVSRGRKTDDENQKAEYREELGLTKDLPSVLVVGGGDGMGGIVDIAKSLGSKLGSSSDSPSFQMVVVCGKNEEAKATLESVLWEAGVQVHVKGFVYNMDEWMKASDALVTKAGPGTIAEASICGLPCMLFSFLPGQEEGNIPYVESSGFGEYSGNPTVIADTVCSWLSSPEKMESMRTAALEAARPSATLDIAHYLAEMLFAHKKKVAQPELATVDS